MRTGIFHLFGCGNSHVGDVLEDEGLVELGVEVLAMDLGLVLGLLVREQVDLDEGIGETRRPIRRREVGALNDLKKESVCFPNLATWF